MPMTMPISLGEVWTGITKPDLTGGYDAVVKRIEDLERTSAVDAARIAVLEAEVLNLRTGR